MNASEFATSFLMQSPSKPELTKSKLRTNLSPAGSYHHQRQQPAAVLVALQQKPAELELILTQRAIHLSAHAGQICFPGGKQDTTDTNMVMTALREAKEEIALPESQVKILGQYSPFYTSTGFKVTPIIALISEHFSAITDPNEVTECFSIPLSFLLESTHWHQHSFSRHGLTHTTYFIPWQDKLIWGATAAIINRLCGQLLK